jgi:hypothetical protein
MEPILKLKFLSHGTLESKDLDFTRKFYEEFLGLEVVRSSNISLRGVSRRAERVCEADRWYGAGSRQSRSSASSQFGSSWR